MIGDGTFAVDGIPGGRGLVVGPELTLEALESLGVAPPGRMHYDPTGVSATLEKCEILGRACAAGLRFERGRLGRVSIFVRLQGDGTDWSQWTLDQEMARKVEHEPLARALFGVALAPRPFPINGKAILPMEIGREHPNHALLDWGEVVSGYDSKGGMAELWIVYADRRPG